MEDLKAREVSYILVVCPDDLKGFSEQTQEVFQGSIIQNCIVHHMRNSLKYVAETNRKVIMKDRPLMYISLTDEGAKTALSAFEAT